MMEGFYKVAQEGSSYVVATFYNPTTKESQTVRVRDYDYADCSRDNDELYHMPIDNAARHQWLRNSGIISVGDTVKVVRGRKVKVGTIATVEAIKPYNDRYGRTITNYVYLSTGERTVVNNCVIYEG